MSGCCRWAQLLACRCASAVPARLGEPRGNADALSRSLWSAYVPVGLTLIAGLGALVPALAPYVLKSFALAIIIAAFSWCLAIAALIVGGTSTNLARARRALLLAGTPWYCLAVYLSTFL